MSGDWWSALPFKRQVFVYTAAAICATALVVELIIEPMVEGNLFPLGADIDWHEVPIWLFGALAVGVGSAVIITRAVMRRLDRLARATEEITHGNLAIRVPEGDNPEDVFNKLSLRFNAMTETIECLLTNERRLLSDISHELRSPLARISAAVELMGMRNSGNGNEVYLKRIEGELAHMNHLVGVLLEQNRNRLAVREGRETVDVSALAAEAADGFRMQGATQRKKLAADIAPGVFVDGHPMQLRLIIENLLSNAMFYAPPDSVVEMRLSLDGDAVRLLIRDGGPGVPDAALRDIFKPFFRVDASRARRSGGVGLGLTLVQDACLALGGCVEAENGRPGLRVAVTLPASGTRLPAT